MSKRILVGLVCIVLVFASGCEFLTTSTASGSPTAVSAATTAADGSATIAPTDTTEATATPEVTAEPTDEPTATVEPTSSGNPTEGMIFPDSDTRLLKWSELIVLSADKLALARNEIYARMGYKFTTAKYADYYGKLSWYQIDPAFSESNFSQIQGVNITLIKVAETVIKGGVYYVPSGTKLDFDQDGTIDTLTYSAPDDNHMNLKIKESSSTVPWNISCDTPSKKVYLGDINYKDGMLDLFVDEFGPSDDNAVYVSGIKHNAFLNRTPSGAMPGAINNTSAKDPFKPDGKGYITTLKRMDFIGTDFFIVKYKLNSSGKLVFVPQASYSFLSYTSDKYMVKTKVPIPLRATASTSSAIAFTIPVGTEVQLVSTDDKKWIKIKTPAGTGWLEMASPLKLANPNIDSFDAFDGLVMAD